MKLGRRGNKMSFMLKIGSVYTSKAEALVVDKVDV